MATQSLYRRYRPRRFGEMKGQEHVVRALRTAVAEGRAGQAYLFSGPRGTGKTTSARILAKVLNCERPVDGEPCCECASCLAVERGTSFDVHELDAASNNGVDAMRDLIEKASLGTPGRHKVYILDEVHMLSKAAEAALLKTLEEPPSHVVFVLATTDPQKMSDTIRSRTQHLQFHLLPAEVLQEHVRWVAADAGLDVSDEAIGRVVARGRGSPRDTLSALELVASAGGDGDDEAPIGDIVEAMVDGDPGRGLGAVARSISLGRDPRTLTDQLIDRLRNGFLSLMAPDLVQLPPDEVEAVAEQARRLGAPGLVRGIEVLGTALGEMRHAPDPRVLIDVAVVQLTAPVAATGVAALEERIRRLERQLEGGDGASSGSPASADPPRDPATGRATIGARAKRAAAAASAAGATATAGAAPGPSDEAAPSTETGEVAAAAGAAPGRSEGSPPSTEAVARAASGAAPAPTGSSATEAVGGTTAAAGSASASAGSSGTDGGDDRSVEAGSGPPGAGRPPAASSRDAAGASAGSSSPPSSSAPSSGAVGSAPPAEPSSAGDAGGPPAGAITSDLWERSVLPGLRGMAKAVFSPATFVSASAGAVTLALPNDVHRGKCEQHRPAVEAALAALTGGPVSIELTTAGGAPVPGAARDGTGERASGGDDADEDVDLDELVDAPPESVKTPIDRLAEAFPGSELVDERD